MFTRKRILLAAALVLLTVLMLVWWPRGGRTPVAAAPARPARAQAQPAVERPIGPPPAQQDPSRPDLPFRIAGVRVEKPRLCRHESTLITITAEHDGGSTGLLEPWIGGKRGWTVPYAPGGELGRQHVRVEVVNPHGERDDRVSSDVEVELLDCVAPYYFALYATEAGSDGLRHHFEARLRPGPAWETHIHTAQAGDPPVVAAAAYQWDFGDGTRLVTRTPEAAHRFPPEGDRPAGEHGHSYLVRVEARDDRGRMLAATHTTVYLDDRIAQARIDSGQVILDAVYDPAPDPGEDDPATAVTLRNLDVDQDARLTAIDIRLLPCDRSEPAEERIPVGAVFADDRVPARGALTGRFGWPRARLEGICSVNATVVGTSEPGGLPVRGDFTLAVAAPDDRVRVTDPELTALLERARRQSGGRLTVGRIHELEDRGLLEPGRYDELRARQAP